MTAAATKDQGPLTGPSDRRLIAEKELAKSEEKLRAVIDNALDGIITIDRFGVIETFNLAAERIFGYPGEEAIGQDVRMLICEPHRSLHQEYLATYFNTGQCRMIADGRRIIGKGREAVGIRKGGERLPIELSVTEMVLDGQTHFIGIVRDITERKASEEQLRRARFAIDHAGDAAYWLGTDGRFSYINEAACQSLGYSQAELLSMKLSDIEADFSPEKIRELLRELKTRRSVKVDSHHRRKDGAVFPVELCIDYLEYGDAEFICAFARDVTSRKRIERELVQAKDAAEEANRAKSAFLANVSHEIRTPMNAVIGMTDLLLEQERQSDKIEYLQMIRTSSESLLALINDLLDLSRIEAKKVELVQGAFSLRDLASEVLHGLAPSAVDKCLELVMHVLPQVPQILVGDRNRLRQVLVNLVGNAIKFTGKGRVTVQIEPAGHASQNEIRLKFKVIDTGIGIPREKQGLIFDAFAQADGSITRQYGGTGLGLAISADLVKLMDGSLEVESSEGQGSVFHFTARFGLTEKSFERSIPAALLKYGETPILVLDNDPTTASIIEELAISWGLKPRVVDNGQAAVREVQRAREMGRAVGLIVADARAPGVSEGDLGSKMRVTHGAQAPPIILLTTSRDPVFDRVKGEIDCVAGHVRKPVSEAELLVSVLGALERRAASNPDPRASESVWRAASRSLRVLLAEDHPVNRKVAALMLGKMGHHVSAAANGKDAVLAMESDDFDLVLMDVQMPEMDGFEATAAIREKEKVTGRHIPIVAMTANAIKGDREKCLKAGMDSYIAKPVKPGELFDVIESLVENKGG